MNSWLAAAQTGTWTAPSSGYIFDSANLSIRPLTGFVGAAVLGQSVANGVDWASVAPKQSSALTVQSGSTVWIPDLSTPAASQSLDRIPLPLQAFWSADSTQAAILAVGSQLIWLTGLGSQPVPLSSWNLESYNRADPVDSSNGRLRSLTRVGEWRILAADSLANQVLLSRNIGGSWQIWLASAAVPPINIPFSGRPAGAAFAPGAGTVFVADSVGHRIVQIQNLQTNPVTTTLLSSEAYLASPSAIALSSDGNRLFVADQTGSIIRVFDVSGTSATGASPVNELPTGVPPFSLTMFGPDRFLLNAGGVSGQAVYFLDTGVSPKVSFVPREQ